MRSLIANGMVLFVLASGLVGCAGRENPEGNNSQYYGSPSSWVNLEDPSSLGGGWRAVPCRDIAEVLDEGDTWFFSPGVENVVFRKKVYKHKSSCKDFLWGILPVCYSTSFKGKKLDSSASVSRPRDSSHHMDKLKEKLNNSIYRDCALRGGKKDGVIQFTTAEGRYTYNFGQPAAVNPVERHYSDDGYHYAVFHTPM